MENMMVAAVMGGVIAFLLALACAVYGQVKGKNVVGIIVSLVFFGLGLWILLPLVVSYFSALINGY